MYTLLVDARDFPNLPTAYVLTPACADIAHANIYQSNSFSIAPGREALCGLYRTQFSRIEWPENWQNAKVSGDVKMGIFLDQVRMVRTTQTPMIQHERCEHMTMRHLRQLGLLNQPRLAQLKVLVSGQADEVADVVVLLDQLGAAQSGGSIGVQLIGEDMPSAVFWKLAFPEHGQIDSLVKARPDLYTMVSSDQPSEEWDIHLSFSDTAQPITTTVYGAVSGPRAAVSMTPLTPSPEADGSTPHPLTPALRVACVAAMIERMLDEVALRNAVPISDAWVTITCRIETTDEEEARAKVSSSDGMPLSMTPTADGLATLARIRLPYPLPLNPFDHLCASQGEERPTDLVDIGLVPWAAPSHPLDLPFAVKPTT